MQQLTRTAPSSRWARVIGVGAILTATVMSWSWPGAVASADSAPTLGCGSTITASVTLTHDLACSGVALFVEPATSTSPPVVVNLAGHRISGIPITGSTGFFVGIFNFAPGTVVENGTISGFSDCVGTMGDSYSALRMHFANCEVFGFGHGPNVSYSVFDHADLSASQSVIALDHDTFEHGTGLTAISGFETYTRVSNSVISGYDTGIRVWDSEASADIERTTIVQGGTGIQLGAALSPNQVPGIVKGNLVSGNAGDGIAVLQDTSIGGYLVSPNQLSITANRLLDNRGDGLRVSAPPAGTLNLRVGRNVAIDNIGNGIAVDLSPNVVLTDLGGDRASGNASPQCAGVTCSA